MFNNVVFQVQVFTPRLFHLGEVAVFPQHSSGQVLRFDRCDRDEGLDLVANCRF